MARKILFEIEVENVGAARRIDALREEIKRLNKEIKGVNEGSEEYRKLTGRVAEAQIEIKDLKEEQKRLNREFQAAKFPKDSLQGLRIEYSKLTEQIKVLSAAERSSPFGQSLIRNAAGVKKEIDGIEQSIGRFTGNVGNYRSAFASFAQILTGGLVGGGAALTINALTNAFSKGLTSVLNYGAGLSRLSAITGVTGDALDDLKIKAEELTTIEVNGQQIVNTAQNIFEAFTLVGSARPELLKNAEALQEVTKQAIILAKASGDDLPTSVRAITSALAQFQLDAADSGEIINTLAAGSKVGKVEIPGLADSITRLGPTAKNSNVSLAETVAIFETMADRGLEGERAAVSLRNVLVRLASAEALPKKAQEAFERVGIDIGILSDKTLPLETRLQELSKAAGDTTTLVEIFGTENLDAAAILASSVPKYAELVSAVQGTNEAFDQAAIKSDNAASRLENLQNKGVNLLTKAFLGAEPAISGVIDLMSGFLDLLSSAPDLVSENAEEFTALSFAVLAFTRTGQTALVTTSAMTASQLSWAVALRGASIAQGISTVATKALTAAMNAMPILAIIAGIYAIVKAFEAYENEASASEKATRAVAEAQQEIAKETAKEVSALQRNIEVLKSETTSKQGRKKAIEELTAAYPEYLKGIDLEKAGTAQLIGLQDQLTKSIFRSAIARKQAAEDEKIVEQIINNQIKADRLRTEGFTQSEKVLRSLARTAGSTAEQAAENLDRENAKLEEQRRLTRERFERITPQELFVVDPGTSVKVKDLTDKTKELGDESAAAGDKIKGLGDKSAGAKQGIEAQAGSVAALKDEISNLEKQIQAIAPGSPKLAEFGKQLRELRKQLASAEAAVKAAELEPEKITPEQPPKLEIITELQPDAAEKLKADALAAQAAVEEALKAIEFPVNLTIKEPTQAEIQVAQEIFNAQKKEGEAADEERKRQAEKERELNELRKQAAIDTAQTISDSLFAIQENRIQRETDAALEALDAETEKKIEAAQGNQAKIKQIEKDAAIKRAAIEKEAARQRKQLSIREAIINTALAITKALTGAPPPANLILAGVAAAAGAAQIAVINSQEFAESGVVKKIKPGIIRERPNVKATPKGDNVLILAKPGEMVLNQGHQNTIRSLFGQDAFALAGVPGERATRRGVPAFASGGVVGIVPQNGFAQQVSTQPVSVEARAEFSAEQVDEIGANMGTIIAAEVARQMRVGLAEGLFDANRRLEREEILNQNRQG